MSKAIDNIYALINNPFVLVDYIIEFYKNYRNHQNKDILLSYLILPLILYEPSRIKLKTSKSSSSLYSFLKTQEVIAGLPERVEEFKPLTNICLQIAFDSGLLTLTEDLSVDCIAISGSSNITCDNEEHEILHKCSANLVKIFKSWDVPAIYRLLGVKTL
ncbi:hypothetical protein BROC_00067 [Candidatus Brocadiaceae bacterium]|nr:hypothetical protein BROC_00067 [Candidatus Brocadiaceae bacterium]